MSKKYEEVKRFYETGQWNKRRVHDAVGRWITADEYEQIVGEPYAEA